MYLIDTNIFLELLLDQEKSDVCQSMLDKIEESKKVFYISRFTVHSIEVNLTRSNNKEVLGDFLFFLTSSRIIRVDTNTEEESEVVKLMEEFNLSFDDALRLYLCEKNSLKLISYDQHFDKTPIQRIEPAEVDF